MITFTAEFCCNIEWATNPTHAKVYIDDALFAKLPQISEGLKALGVFSGELLNSVAHDLFREDDGNLELFEPEYRIGYTVLRVYADGEIMVIFNLKHSSEEGFIGPLKLSEGVKT